VVVDTVTRTSRAFRAA